MEKPSFTLRKTEPARRTRRQLTGQAAAHYRHNIEQMFRK
jgi:hypothetical protein